MRKRAAGFVLVVMALAGCSGGGTGDEVARLEAQLEELEAELTNTREELEAEPTGPDLDGDAKAQPCEVSFDGGVAEQLASDCTPTCQAALTFANGSTNPGMSDALAYEAAYVRLTRSDGVEPAENEPVAWEDSSIEMVAVRIDRTDPNAPSVNGWYTRWGPTGVDPADAHVSYDAHWFVDEHEVDLGSDEGWVEVLHPLRDTAQFIDTPIGCFPNPHRVVDAADRASPPVTTTTTTTEPPTTSPDLGDIAEGRSAFTELVRTYCDPERVPNPDEAQVEPLGDGLFAVTDANGDQLLLDVNRAVVTSGDGGEQPLPMSYSFGCDPGVFVGTMPN